MQEHNRILQGDCTQLLKTLPDNSVDLHLYSTAPFRYPFVMTEIIEPKPQFQSLTEAEVMAALTNTNPDNPVALELARLIQGYSANFHQHVQRLGYMPPHFLHLKARWPIEAVAMRITTETIRQTIAKTRT